MQIDLLGTSFSIATDEEPEYVEKLLRFLEDKIADTGRNVRTDDPLKISIITALMVADELFQLQSQLGTDHARSSTSKNPEHQIDIQQITQDLIRQLDLRLQD
ncbi:cell division protein ZapA [Spirochaeta dissipatitropha]